jgi:hypothetical protein
MVTCDYCGNPACLVTGKDIYPHLTHLHTNKFWQCLPCRAYVGVHKGSSTNKPLGRLADAELRRMKIQVHDLFDPLWKSGKMNRHAAYKWLANELGIDPRECHVGMFDNDRCARALRVLSKHTKPRVRQQELLCPTLGELEKFWAQSERGFLYKNKGSHNES